MRSLLLGCGNSREKKVFVEGDQAWRGVLTTLDMDPHCGADIQWDLEKHPFPFDDETFDELAAYDVLEHLGRQGDWRGWFDEMAEYWRLLKPGGTFGIIVPINADALADPGHTRFFHANHFGFLTRDYYERNLADHSPITDYRWYIKRYWAIDVLQNLRNHHLAVVLRKVE